MKRKGILLTISAIGALAMSAQTNSNSASKWDDESFEDFRRSMYEEYNEFRRSMLEEYDKFLDGIWEEVTVNEGFEKYPRKKPDTPQTIEMDPIDDVFVTQGGFIKPTLQKPQVPDAVIAAAGKASAPRRRLRRQANVDRLRLPQGQLADRAGASINNPALNQPDVQSVVAMQGGAARNNIPASAADRTGANIANPALAQPDAQGVVAMQGGHATPNMPGVADRSGASISNPALNQADPQRVTSIHTGPATPNAPGVADRSGASINNPALNQPDVQQVVAVNGGSHSSLQPGVADRSSASVSNPDLNFPMPSGVTAMQGSAAKPSLGGLADPSSAQLSNPNLILPPPAPENEYAFDFHGVELTIENVPLKIGGRLLNPEDFGPRWREFRKSDADKLIDAVDEMAQRYNLNDYLTFDAVKAYANYRYADSHPSARLALVQYVMVGLGYDVRIGLHEGNTLLMFPAQQKVFGGAFLTTNDVPYYLYDEDPESKPVRLKGSVRRCKIPDDIDPGKPFDLELNDLQLPEKDQDFEFAFADFKLTGTLNANLMPVLYHYPQMQTAGFASSCVSPELRASLVSQVRNQLAGKSQLEAVNTLLHFIQSGFKYKTDDQLHGFEKPYFMEEMLYYPACDCEDRAIFYTYLLWNALGVENHLVAFPLHESASVRLDEPIQGHNYQHDGKTYFISDPTYIRASTGKCMPQYKKELPTIDKIYSN